jgi:SARP family transcriptional regulator, regulator of embCAB operon
MLRVHLTGRVSLSIDDTTVGERALAGRLGRILLVRLALDCHPVDRDRLVEDLWPHGAPPAADSVLNATFSRLRTAFTDLGIDGRTVLRSSGGVAQFCPPADTRIDVITAAQSIDAAEGALRRGASSEAWTGAVVAQAIARRPLLPGLDRLWLDVERDRLLGVLERSYALLADVWLERGDAHQSATMARELIRCAPYSESAHRRLVLALLALDDRPAAAHAVARWEAVLSEDLGLRDHDGLRRLLT